MLGLPFALVQGREFVAWRLLAQDTLELSVQDLDQQMVRTPPLCQRLPSLCMRSLPPEKHTATALVRL